MNKQKNDVLTAYLDAQPSGVGGSALVRGDMVGYDEAGDEATRFPTTRLRICHDPDIPGQQLLVAENPGTAAHGRFFYVKLDNADRIAAANGGLQFYTGEQLWGEFIPKDR